MAFVKYARKELAIAVGALALLLVLVLIGGLLVFDDWRWAMVAALPVVIALFCIPLPFRCPTRPVPRGEHRILAPADGTIFDIGEVDGPDGIDEPCVRIGIMISPYDPHVTRAPCSGRVDRVVRSDGAYRSMLKPQVISAENASTLVLIGNAAGTDAAVAVKQFAGPVLRTVVCELNEGDDVERGQVYGMLKFGSRVELFVPRSANFKLRAKLGASMEGGRTVLGSLEPAAPEEPEADAAAAAAAHPEEHPEPADDREHKDSQSGPPANRDPEDHGELEFIEDDLAPPPAPTDDDRPRREHEDGDDAGALDPID
jgi:phosphatidylserine decarboxylase